MVAPKHPPPLQRERVAPAPWMDHDERCSDCDVKAVPAGEGLYKVCPRCFGVLWAVDRSVEARAAKTAAVAAAAEARAEGLLIKRENLERRQRLRPPRNLFAEDLDISSPEIGVPTLGIVENKDAGESD